MSPNADTILAALDRVAALREERRRDKALNARVEAVKDYQQRRFAKTYADLLSTARHGPAARFFLDELYGPGDFSQRDAQFEKVVPALARLFPEEVIGTVRLLAELHRLSESLDNDMAHRLNDPELDRSAYVHAWQATGRAQDREAQIAFTLQIGQALDRYTRKPLLRHSLRMMRGPAAAAGLSSLQGFLESGFAAFRAMRGAKEFLAAITQRERAFAAALFAPGAVASVPGVSPSGGALLDELP